MGGRGPGRMITSPGEKRPQLSVGLGVPGHPGTGALYSTEGMVRRDLGSVPVTTTSGVVASDERGGFIGNMTSVFFGRKGGLW